MTKVTCVPDCPAFMLDKTREISQTSVTWATSVQGLAADLDRLFAPVHHASVGCPRAARIVSPWLALPCGAFG